MLRLTLLIALILGPTLAEADINLTGLYLFGADSSGNVVPPDAAYTFAPNGGSYVLWIAAGGYNAPLLNGPHRDDAAISIPLSPGSYVFSIFNSAGFSEGQSIFPGPIPAYVGLNMFFGGNIFTPGISVFTATNDSVAGPFPTIAADAGNTLDLPGDQNVPGAGSLAFANGGYNVTLRSFVYSDPLVYNTDKISNFDAFPDGNRDYVGQFTLDVTATPEPSFRVSMFLGLTALALALRYRRSYTAPAQSIRVTVTSFGTKLTLCGHSCGQGFAIPAKPVLAD